MHTFTPTETETLNIRLNELVKNVHTPAQLSQLLDDYDSSLNPFHNNQINTILPILQQRLKKIAALYKRVAIFRSQAWEQAEQLSLISQERINTLTTMAQMSRAEEAHTDIDEQLQQEFQTATVINTDIHKLYLTAMDEAFEESALHLGGMAKKYKKLCTMHSKGETTDDWLIEQIRNDQQTLSHYATLLALNTLTRATLKTYQKTIAAYPDTFRFNELLRDKKASNPVISDELMQHQAQAMQQLMQQSQYFKQWINLLARYQQKLSGLNDHMVCFGIIADRLRDSEGANEHEPADTH